MNRADNQLRLIESWVSGAGATSCRRRDLDDWASRGGPLPVELAAHVQSCPGCADRVRRTNEVHAGLLLLRTQAAPADLAARANGRALRMLRRAARASEAARRLLRMRPELTRWQRAQVHLARVTCAAAAAVLVLVTRASVDRGLARTRTMGEVLAERHWERHIDPGREWLGHGNDL